MAGVHWLGNCTGLTAPGRRSICSAGRCWEKRKAGQAIRHKHVEYWVIEDKWRCSLCTCWEERGDLAVDSLENSDRVTFEYDVNRTHL